jgi:hypothetical protein
VIHSDPSWVMLPRAAYLPNEAIVQLMQHLNDLVDVTTSFCYKPRESTAAKAAAVTDWVAHVTAASRCTLCLKRALSPPFSCCA